MDKKDKQSKPTNPFTTIGAAIIGKWTMLSIVWLVVGGLAYTALNTTNSPWVMTVMIIPFLATANLTK